MAETLEGWKEQALAAMEEHAALEEKCTDLELAHAELVESSTAAEEEVTPREIFWCAALCSVPSVAAVALNARTCRSWKKDCRNPSSRQRKPCGLPTT